MKKDEKNKHVDAPQDEASGEEGIRVDQPTDMETALRCIQLLDDLEEHGQEMVEGIIDTIRNIGEKMTNPYAKKLLEERLRKFAASEGKESD